MMVFNRNLLFPGADFQVPCVCFFVFLFKRLFSLPEFSFEDRDARPGADELRRLVRGQPQRSTVISRDLLYINRFDLDTYISLP